MRCIRSIASVSVLVLCFGAATKDADAQQMSTARYGQRYYTLGFVAQPGVITDDDAPPTGNHKQFAPTYAAALKLALHHMFSPSVAMSAELDLGYQWADFHTAHPEGESSGQEGVLMWQVGLVGRWFPSGDLSGLSVGGGLHWHRAGFEAAPVQGMYGEVRLGWTLWQGEQDPRFMMLELGWGAPLIQGLSLPDVRISREGDEQEVPRDPDAATDWSWSRGVISVQVSF